MSLSDKADLEDDSDDDADYTLIMKMVSGVENTGPQHSKLVTSMTLSHPPAHINVIIIKIMIS